MSNIGCGIQMQNASALRFPPVLPHVWNSTVIGGSPLAVGCRLAQVNSPHATEKESLATELLELATKYDFEFSDEELSESELDQVAGGATAAEVDLKLLLPMAQKDQVEKTISNIMKVISSTDYSDLQNFK